jgi:uncharacterized integral membrane protein
MLARSVLICEFLNQSTCNLRFNINNYFQLQENMYSLISWAIPLVLMTVHIYAVSRKFLKMLLILENIDNALFCSVCSGTYKFRRSLKLGSQLGIDLSIPVYYYF